jgi:NitT/TauT family transport system substrate-binding protein
MHIMQSRRRFLASLSLAGAAGLVGAPRPALAEPPPETTTVRLPGWSIASCEGPEYVAENLLRAEGFSDVRYVEGKSGVDSAVWIAQGEIDFDWNYGATHITSIEAGVPITVLAGLHSGCLELIANDSVHRVKELRGKRVGVFSYNSSPHILVMLMAAYVGLDPQHDIQWIPNSEAAPMDLFVEGKIDAFLGTPPEPQILRAKKVGHTILATAEDRPWSEYFCCMLAGTRDYVSRYPVATKRVMRALLKAVDLCASDPQSVATQLAGGTLRSRSDYALETLTDARYDKWREFDPEDTLRFYALQMHDAGMIKSDPNKIITEGTDWRFLNEIKRELKT